MTRAEDQVTDINQAPTASGEPVTDELVQALADETDGGYDPEKLRLPAGSSRSDPRSHE
jgi:hypothetical protein